MILKISRYTVILTIILYNSCYAIDLLKGLKDFIKADFQVVKMQNDKLLEGNINIQAKLAENIKLLDQLRIDIASNSQMTAKVVAGLDKSIQNINRANRDIITSSTSTITNDPKVFIKIITVLGGIITALLTILGGVITKLFALIQYRNNLLESNLAYKKALDELIREKTGKSIFINKKE